MGKGTAASTPSAYSNGLAGGTKLTGAELRQRCKQHATLLLASVEDWAPDLDVREMLTTSMGGWDLDELRGEAPSAEAWIDRMGRQGIWIDQAAMQVVADLLEVQIHYHLVQHDGQPLRQGVMDPRPSTPVRTQLEVALLMDERGEGRHYVAVAPPTRDPSRKPGPRKCAAVRPRAAGAATPRTQP